MLIYTSKMAAAVKGLLSICIVVLILASSWLIAVLFNYYSGEGKDLPVHKNSELAPFPGERMENIFWFVQISDLHISKFYQPSRVQDLKIFCSDVIDSIKPAVVLATGDLTDAKHQDRLGSQQYQEEWETYASVLRKTGVEYKTKWLDLRGNHDAFDVSTLHTKQNYYRFYSSSGKDTLRGSSSYQYVYKTSYGEYIFNAIDSCPDPGPKRPFNFFGYVSKARINEMNQLAEMSKTANMSVWFGHYPFSVVTSSSLRNILRYGTVYLCGHLHTLAEIVPVMHAVHKNGHLELELGDWLLHRNFRVAAIDHDLFSFVDVRLYTWPIILITNPKDAHYMMPTFEPIGRINKSTHIRMLIFSTSSIESVTVAIDGVSLESPAQHVKGPLHVCKWEPHLYPTGTHTLTVKAKDSQGNQNVRRQQFSIDGTRPRLDLFPAILLLTDFCTLGRITFYVLAVIIVLGLWAVRQCCSNETDSSGYLRGLTNRWLYNLSELTKTNSLFYPLFVYGVYIVVGPWYIGELITNHVGCMFVFGLYVNGHFIPGSLTFYYGIVQLLTFNLPLTICLTKYIGFRRGSPLSRPCPERSSSSTSSHFMSLANCSRCFTHLVYFGVITFQSTSCYGIWRAYGDMAFAINPVKTWSIPLAAYLWVRTNYY